MIFLKKFELPTLPNKFSKTAWQAGITQITMYHGQKLVQGHGTDDWKTGALRVANGITAAAVSSYAFNARTKALLCPGKSRWYPSIVAPATPKGAPYKDLLAAWGAKLVASGFINEEALGHIYPKVAEGAKRFVASNFRMINAGIDYAIDNWLPSEVVKVVLDADIRGYRKA